MFNDISKTTDVKLYKEGSLIFDYDNPEKRNLVILLSGKALMYENYKTDKTSLGEMPVKSQYGLHDIFYDTKKNITIVAQTNVTIVSITKKEFKNFLAKNAECSYEFLQLLTTELSTANDTVNELLIKIAREIPVSVVMKDATKKNLLYPEKYKFYDIPMKKESRNFLIDTQQICPNCKSKFFAKIPHFSSLRTAKSMDWDMKLNYNDFEIWWHNILTCPHCYFSAILEYFSDPDVLDKSPDIDAKLAEIKPIIEFDFDAPKTIDLVFAMHYLALICADGYKNTYLIKSKIWMQLTYLSQECLDIDMIGDSIIKAKLSNEDLLGKTRLTPEQEQITNLTLAHLNFRLNNFQVAYRYLSDVITNKNGMPIYKRIAENKIEMVKKKNTAK